jgi:hypothetical protein
MPPSASRALGMLGAPADAEPPGDGSGRQSTMPAMMFRPAATTADWSS